MSKKLYIKTYGCQMNMYDSQKMSELLQPHGFSSTDSQEDADLVILNTCHIREKAAEKVYSELGRVRNIKNKHKDDMMIAVAGCVAQAEGEEIFKRAPYVDMVVGPQSYHNLPQMIENAKRTKDWQIDLDFPEDSKFDKLPQSNADSVSAFLSVQEGCDKFCNFCVVPYTRGAEYSRSVAEIYREALKLVNQGVKDVMLLGQNVSAFHGDFEGESWTLGKLIKKLSDIEGLERIKYMTSHPRDMVDEELFEAHANINKLMPYLHLPVQSGSNKILKAMNRKHTREEYFEIIKKFQDARPDIVFSSDFIVGYPGETEEDFLDTMDLVQRVNYSQCFSFKYSKRPGTPAATIEEQVPEDVKADRLQRLQKLLFEKQRAFNESCIGKTMPVLFEKEGKMDGQLFGRTPYMQQVFVKAGTELQGKTVDVKITTAGQNSLAGVVC